MALKNKRLLLCAVFLTFLSLVTPILSTTIYAQDASPVPATLGPTPLLAQAPAGNQNPPSETSGGSTLANTFCTATVGAAFGTPGYFLCQQFKGSALAAGYGLDLAQLGSFRILTDVFTAFTHQTLALILGDTCFTKKMEGLSTNTAATCETEDLLGSGVIGGLSQKYATLYQAQPDINMAHFMRDGLANNLLNPTPTYAQNVGPQVLGEDFFGNISPIWSWTLNIAYGFTVLFLLMVGFSMLLTGTVVKESRVKIFDLLGQLFITLLVMTFSFLIAKITFDVVNAMAAGAFSLLEGLANEKSVNLPALFGENYSISRDFGLLSMGKLLFLPILDMSLGNGDLAGILVAIVALVVGLIYGALLWAKLAKRLVKIYLAVMFAPLILLFGLWDNRKGVVGHWFKCLVAWSMAPVVCLILLNIAMLIVVMTQPQGNLANISGTGTGLLLFMGPIGGAAAIAGSSTITVATGLLGIGILIATTYVPGAIDKRWGTTSFVPSRVATNGIDGFSMLLPFSGGGGSTSVSSVSNSTSTTQTSGNTSSTNSGGTGNNAPPTLIGRIQQRIAPIRATYGPQVRQGVAARMPASSSTAGKVGAGAKFAWDVMGKGQQPHTVINQRYGARVKAGVRSAADDAASRWAAGPRRGGAAGASSTQAGTGGPATGQTGAAGTSTNQSTGGNSASAGTNRGTYSIRGANSPSPAGATGTRRTASSAATSTPTPQQIRTPNQPVDDDIRDAKNLQQLSNDLDLAFRAQAQRTARHTMERNSPVHEEALNRARQDVSVIQIRAKADSGTNRGQDTGALWRRFIEENPSKSTSAYQEIYPEIARAVLERDIEAASRKTTEQEQRYMGNIRTGTGDFASSKKSKTPAGEGVIIDQNPRGRKTNIEETKQPENAAIVTLNRNATPVALKETTRQPVKNSSPTPLQPPEKKAA